jgi:hypothetical protein
MRTDPPEAHRRLNVARRLGAAEFRWTVAAFAVVVIGLWALAPGTEPTWFMSYYAVFIVYSTWLNLRRAPLWAEGGHLLTPLLALLLWRVGGLQLLVAIALGGVVHLALVVARFVGRRSAAPT